MVYFENPRTYLHAISSLDTDAHITIIYTDIERTYGQRKPLAARTPLDPNRPRSVSVSVSTTQTAENTRPGTPEDTEDDEDVSTPDLTEGGRTETEGETETETEIDVVEVELGRTRRAGRRKVPRREEEKIKERLEDIVTRHDLDNKYFAKDLLVFKNFDGFRSVSQLLPFLSLFVC